MEMELVQEATSKAGQVELRATLGHSAAESAVQAADGIAWSPWLTPVSYYAIDIDEAHDKARFDCHKVPVRLTVMGAGDAVLRATEGLTALNRVRAHRLVYEAIAQGGILSPADLAFLLGVSLASVGDILTYYGAQGEPLRLLSRKA